MMTLQNLVQNTYDVFLENLPEARIVLLHPRSRYRSVLVAKLINSDTIKTIYYAMGPDDLNLQSFISGLTHDLANQHPTFGRHVNMLAPGVFQEGLDGIDAIVRAFAADLGEITDDDFLFIVDEYDRSDTADDIQRFIEVLTDYLPPQCRIVLNSRTLPRLPWVSLVAQRRAVLLEDDQLITRNFYEIVEEGDTKLEIYALGPGHVSLNDVPIDTWEGHLPRLLFFFALDRPIVTRSEICQAFWPELESDQAVNVFHVTKRRLHKALDIDVLVHIDGYYCVNPDLAVQYDVMEFVELLVLGRDETLDKKTRMRAWQRCIEMYNGPFLQGHSDRWIVERREDYQTGYLEALTSMAMVRLEEERNEHALSLFQKALTEDNSRQDIHREVMKLYAMMGRRSEAAAHYKHLMENHEPEAATVQVYDEIMS